MKKYFLSTIIFFVIFLAFWLRFYKITQNPPSLNWDEVSIGYNAYSILKTGKDEWGETFPTHFRSYGEYKLPAQIYFSIPGIAIFGLNELGVRITPVVYGTLTVLIVYFLASLLFKNRYIGLISAFLLAISPWHIHLTRASFESSFSLFWISLGALLLIKGFEKPKWWILSVLPFAISIYTYNSARIFTLIFLITVFFVYRKNILKDLKIFLFCILFFVITLIPLLMFFMSGEATARLKLVSISDDPGFTLRINEVRGNLKLPQPLPRLVHNKVTHFTYVFTKNYLAHFTPSFLFINGAGHKQHHVQNVGQFYLFQAPFILIGFYFLLREKQKYRWVLVSWILLAFIPVSITGDSIPHALRTLLAVVPYEIICAYGIYRVCKNKPLIFAVTAIVITFSMKSYLNNYYNVYPKLYSRDWQYGYKQVVEFIKDRYSEYDLIVFSRHYGEPHMFTLFFMRWDPGQFQNDPNLNRFETYDWVRVLNFDKFYFPDLGDEGTRYQDVVAANPNKKILFVGKPGDFPDGTQILERINFLNYNEAFEIVEK
ncbi:MAG: glycosyltransferase family 39 protein [Patescibacteria group bacterium]